MTEKEFYDIIGGNYNDALSRLMNDTFIRKFVVKFKDDPSFSELSSALSEEKWDEAFSAAHTLKGVALNMAFARLGDSATRITDMLRPQNRERFDKQKVMDAFDEVKADYNTVCGQIEKLQ